jgi:opacity protein-like surface antigen
MKHALLLILLSMVFCGVSAAKPDAFMTTGLNRTNPEADLYHRAAKGGFGGEFTFGFQQKWTEVYFGYAFNAYRSSHPVPLFAGETGADGDWGSGRALLGLRVLPIKNPTVAWLHPFIGGGLSLGSLKRHTPTPDGLEWTTMEYRPDHSGTVSSTTNLGWFFEAGMRVDVANHVAVDISGQGHHFTASFYDNYERDTTTLHVILSGVQARLVYAL